MHPLIAEIKERADASDIAKHAARTHALSCLDQIRSMYTQLKGSDERVPLLAFVTVKLPMLHPLVRQTLSELPVTEHRLLYIIAKFARDELVFEQNLADGWDEWIESM